MPYSDRELTTVAVQQMIADALSGITGESGPQGEQGERGEQGPPGVDATVSPATVRSKIPPMTLITPTDVTTSNLIGFDTPAPGYPGLSAAIFLTNTGGKNYNLDLGYSRTALRNNLQADIDASSSSNIRGITVAIDNNSNQLSFTRQGTDREDALRVNTSTNTPHALGTYPTTLTPPPAYDYTVKSPSGTSYRIIVADDGTLSTEQV